MIYSVRLYTVDPPNVPGFLAAFRIGGLWTEIARLQPGHIHTDLLRNPSDSTKFLSIEFWTSVQTMLAARRSFEVRSFLAWLDRQAIGYEGLGMFVFPAQLSVEATKPICAPDDRAGLEAVPEFQNAGAEIPA